MKKRDIGIADKEFVRKYNIICRAMDCLNLAVYCMDNDDDGIMTCAEHLQGFIRLDYKEQLKECE